MPPAGRGNRLLKLLDAKPSADFGPLVTVQLTARQVLREPGIPSIHVYFPATAVVSLITTMESGASAEIALVGREGMIGLDGILGTDYGLTSAVVQVAGEAVRVPAAALRAARLVHPAVRKTLDLYTQARFVQIAQSAACGRLHGVEPRLARWLLGIHDRIEGDEFVVPQELIAEMLGVQRPTVSSALQRLRDDGIIARRGRAIVIADRARLDARACECHRIISREFERLLTRDADEPGPIVAAVPGSSATAPEAGATIEGMREIAGRLLLASIREQEARERAEEANRAKDRFLAMVSHELRNPLNVIIGWCARLTSRRDQPVEQGLGVIARSAHAQMKLIDDLLDAARMTAATLTIEPAPVSLPQVVDDVVSSIAPAAEEKHVTVSVVAADTLPFVFGDAGRLRQVLLNILTNALKFTDAGESIEVRLSVHGGRARMIVHDTGRGIDPAVLPHVFERFRQGTASAASHDGLGLGLTIARALVELHRGTIAIESDGADQGTTCTIELPLMDAGEQPAAALATVQR